MPNWRGSTRTSRPQPADGDPLPALRRFCRRARAIGSASCWRPAARRPTRSAAARSCCRRSGCSPPRSARSPTSTSGASAGLNLLLDRYRYTYVPGGSVGGPSPVDAGVRDARRGPGPGGDAGRAPARRARPLARRRRAIPSSGGGWRRACGRTRRTASSGCAAALAIAADAGLDIRQGDAVADTAALAATLDAHPVITNTWVLNYLSGAERAAYVANLDELGRRRDVSWVFAESPVLVPELPVADRTQAQTALVLVRWRARPPHRHPPRRRPPPRLLAALALTIRGRRPSATSGSSDTRR